LAHHRFCQHREDIERSRSALRPGLGRAVTRAALIPCQRSNTDVQKPTVNGANGRLLNVRRRRAAVTYLTQFE
jgi:hypothetical protein